nr:hypothetical protein A5881_000995 [Enterococcus termitis]
MNQGILKKQNILPLLLILLLSFASLFLIFNKEEQPIQDLSLIHI